MPKKASQLECSKTAVVPCSKRANLRQIGATIPPGLVHNRTLVGPSEVQILFKFHVHAKLFPRLGRSISGSSAKGTLPRQGRGRNNAETLRTDLNHGPSGSQCRTPSATWLGALAVPKLQAPRVPMTWGGASRVRPTFYVHTVLFFTTPAPRTNSTGTGCTPRDGTGLPAL
jgi:hypothetical protein